MVIYCSLKWGRTSSCQASVCDKVERGSAQKKWLLLFLTLCLHCVTFTCCSLCREALQKKPEEINRRSADMWSFAVLLWELVTREVPFADLSNMEIGMKVSRAITDKLTHLVSIVLQTRLDKTFCAWPQWKEYYQHKAIFYNKCLLIDRFCPCLSCTTNCLFLPSDRLRGFETHYPPWHLTTHLQAHEDMHERRPSEEA